MQNINNNTTST